MNTTSNINNDRSDAKTPNISVRNDTATTTCPQCGSLYTRTGRQQWCSNKCRQTVWRHRHPTPPQRPLPAPTDVIYQCPECETRYLNDRRCPNCNTWCRKLGHGGTCPHCDEPVAITDLTP